MRLRRRRERPARIPWEQRSSGYRELDIQAAIDWNPAIRQIGSALEVAGIATEEQRDAFIYALGEFAARS